MAVDANARGVAVSFSGLLRALQNLADVFRRGAPDCINTSELHEVFKRCGILVSSLVDAVSFHDIPAANSLLVELEEFNRSMLAASLVERNAAATATRVSWVQWATQACTTNKAKGHKFIAASKSGDFEIVNRADSSTSGSLDDVLQVYADKFASIWVKASEPFILEDAANLDPWPEMLPLPEPDRLQ